MCLCILFSDNLDHVEICHTRSLSAFSQTKSFMNYNIRRGKCRLKDLYPAKTITTLTIKSFTTEKFTLTLRFKMEDVDSSRRLQYFENGAVGWMIIFISLLPRLKSLPATDNIAPSRLSWLCLRAYRASLAGLDVSERIKYKLGMLIH